MLSIQTRAALLYTAARNVAIRQLGDVEGHPFHGNQWKVGGAGHSQAVKEWRSWSNSLTPADKQTLDKYQSGEFTRSDDPKGSINEQLRSGINPKDAVKLSTALNKAVAPRDLVLYRGVSNEQRVTGDAYSDKGFMSTSLNQAHAASNYANPEMLHNPQILELHVPKDTRGVAYLDSQNGGKWSGGEGEVLLDRGMRWDRAAERTDAQGRQVVVLHLSEHSVKARRALTPKILASHENTPLHKAADAHYRQMMLVVSAAFMRGKKAYKSGGAKAAVSAIRASLLETLPKVLTECLAAGGNVALGKFRAAGDVEGHEFHGNQWTHGALLNQGAKLELEHSRGGDVTYVWVRHQSGSASSYGRVEEHHGEFHAKAEDVHLGVHATKNAAIGAVLARSGWRAAELRTLKPGPKPSAPKIEQRFDVSNPAAVKWAKDHGAELAKGISETSKQRIKDVVARAVEGDDAAYDDILEAVGSEARADLIARTEVMTAANEGQREAWDQAVESGLLTGDEKRTWIATTGCCDECDELDGETTDLDGEYPGNGGDGPPLHPNCRCTEGIVG